jgi:RNA-directed DNA polymerase
MPSSTGGRWKRGGPVGHLRVPGRCAERCHHDGLVGTQPTDQSLPHQRSTLLTHICAKGRNGGFWVKRITISKRMRAKLKAINIELKRRRHQPIPVQGRWLGSVVRGHLAYYAVPGNTDRLSDFRCQVTRHWFKALGRRSQRSRLNWTRMDRIARRWLPPVRVQHPYPQVRFAATTRGRSPVR